MPEETEPDPEPWVCPGIDRRPSAFWKNHADKKPERPTKKEVLEKAIEAVADRGLNYGKPEDNFLRIARRWKVHFLNRYGMDVPVDPHDVALMMDDVKSARIENSPTHIDSWVDKAGYSACGANLPEPESNG